MPETKEDPQSMLEEAVIDLLGELRIDTHSLGLMAHGLSPDSPGVPLPSSKNNVKGRADWRSPQPKVQISQLTAQKLYMGLGLNKKCK